MRLFFAVALAEPVRAAVAALVPKLEGEAKDAHVVWEPAANMHLTLRFLGEVPDAFLPEVEAAGREVAAGVAPFELTLQGTGSFGGRSPRVLWVGARRDEGYVGLGALARALEARARSLGFDAEEKPFAPHVTLGRVKPHEKPGASEALLAAVERHRTFKSEPMPVRRFVLFESRPTARRPEYVERASFELREKD